jgi:hypothetical protein
MLVGILLTVLLYGATRRLKERHRAKRAERIRERRMKEAAKTPLPQLWNPGPARTASGTHSRHPHTGSINDYLDGPRQRPDFNPTAGPRDW